MAVKPLAYLPIALFALMAGVMASGMFRADPEALPSTRVGQKAPDVALGPLADKPGFDAEALHAPGVKLVNFWASWCAPCRVEHPNLEALAAEGIPIYGINYKDDNQNALAFLEELGDPYTGVGADPGGRVAFDWGVYGVPETYVIDGEGKVLLRFAGPVTQRALRERIRPVMDGASP
ncbi:MAG: DsbE family thiol:disulfide interchange protein [Pseudomonadota bacterium]